MEDRNNKMELDFEELENVTGGISDSRKAKIRDYVNWFRRKGFTLEATKRNWSEKGENAGLSRGELEEDFRYIDSIF